MLTLGIDEVARGPIIGSMFIAGTMFDEKDLVKLKELGVKDSKLLEHSKRVELAKKIKKLAKKIKIIEVKPKEIDEAVESETGMNLNWLEALKQAEIINELKPDRAIIDCPSTNPKAFTEYLKKHIKKEVLSKVKLIVEHHADFNFLECSSASIIAKCKREAYMEKLRKDLKINCGSGYPSDPYTQEFIKDNYKKYPAIFRKSWQTYRNLVEGKKQKKLGEF
ncbi:MAG TPA: ribonuclease HII [Candidatus Nanoarchaeia archaeon]|nr:ribonuclease HII [Candidatus Nanoarchaeia archaeon]